MSERLNLAQEHAAMRKRLRLHAGEKAAQLRAEQAAMKERQRIRRERDRQYLLNVGFWEGFENLCLKFSRSREWAQEARMRLVFGPTFREIQRDLRALDRLRQGEGAFFRRLLP